MKENESVCQKIVPLQVPSYESELVRDYRSVRLFRKQTGTTLIEREVRPVFTTARLILV